MYLFCFSFRRFHNQIRQNGGADTVCDISCQYSENYTHEGRHTLCYVVIIDMAHSLQHADTNKTSTGAVAAEGMIRATGAKNRARRKHILVNTTVSPVFPPASIPAEDSR